MSYERRYKPIGAKTELGDLSKVGASSGDIFYFDGSDWTLENLIDLVEVADATITGQWTFEDDVHIDNGSSLFIFDSTDTDSAEFSHDGADLNTAFTTTDSWNITGLSGAMKISSNVNINGGTLRIIDAGGTDNINFSHDGTDASTGFVNTADWNIDGFTGGVIFHQPGNAFTDSAVRITGDAASIMFTEEDQAGGDEAIWTWGVGTRDFRLRTFTDALGAGADAISVRRADNSTNIEEIILSSDLTRAGTNIADFQVQALSLGDDVTGSVTFGGSRTGGIVFMTTTDTNNTPANDYAIFYINSNGTITVLWEAAGRFSFGSGTNPDVDGDINVWSASAGVLSVKNRRGQARRIQIFLMG